eukprot:5111201-Amphidinium_carterae.1
MEDMCSKPKLVVCGLMCAMAELCQYATLDADRACDRVPYIVNLFAEVKHVSVTLHVRKARSLRAAARLCEVAVAAYDAPKKFEPDAVIN